MFHLVDFCRLCLSNEHDLNNMCYDNIIEKVQACIQDLEFDDQIPALVCSKCLKQLDEFFEFRNRCLQSEFILTRHIEKLTHPRNKPRKFVNTKLKVHLLNNFAASEKRLGNVRVSDSATNEPDLTISDDSIISVDDDDDDIFFEELFDAVDDGNVKNTNEEQEERNTLSDTANFLATDITEHVKTRKRQVQILAEEKIRRAFEGDVSTTETDIKAKKTKLRAQARKRLKSKKVPKDVNFKGNDVEDNNRGSDSDLNNLNFQEFEAEYNNKESGNDLTESRKTAMECHNGSMPFIHSSLIPLPVLHNTSTADYKKSDYLSSITKNVRCDFKKPEVKTKHTDKLIGSKRANTEFSYSDFDDISIFDDKLEMSSDFSDPLDINHFSTEHHIDFEIDSSEVGNTIDVSESTSEEPQSSNSKDLLCYESLDYHTIDSDLIDSFTKSASSPSLTDCQNSAEEPTTSASIEMQVDLEEAARIVVNHPALNDHNYICRKSGFSNKKKSVLRKQNRSNSRLNDLLLSLKKKTQSKNASGMHRYFYDSALKKYNLPMIKKRRKNRRACRAANFVAPIVYLKKSTDTDSEIDVVDVDDLQDTKRSDEIIQRQQLLDADIQLDLKRRQEKNRRLQLRLSMQLLRNTIKQIPPIVNDNIWSAQRVLSTALVTIKNLKLEHEELEEHKKTLRREHQKLVQKLKNLYFS